MAFLGPLITFLLPAATTAAVSFGVTELLKDDPDLPPAEAPPGRTSAEVTAAADKERRRRAGAFTRAETFLSPRSTLGVPLPSIPSPAQKEFLG